ncbi:DUF1015 domain-containing protein [Candidatus Woesearchaeota archaeon]|nr:DUF1015 domain-containing protein [Candidatus Woesearchaeota archaeon]
MVEITPFKGLFYSKEKIKDFRFVVTPPYDVISEEEKKIFLADSPYNLAHVLLPENGENRYTNAAELMKKWVSEGVLVNDDEACIYVYAQEYILKKYRKKPVRKVRKGFIALAKLEDYEKKVILPHEKTLSKPKEDRMNLMKAVHANLGQLFMLYHDANGVMTQIIEAEAKKEPFIEFTDSSGIKHTLWKVSDKVEIDNIQKEMADRKTYIADGHHRYETALNFSKDNPELEGAQYRMMTLINVDDEGLLVLPTHRLVHNLESLELKKLEGDLLKEFDLEIYEFDDANEELQRNKMLDRMKGRFKKHVFGMLCKGMKRYYLITLKDNKTVANENVSKRLDVSILHDLILDKLLGIDAEALKSQKYADYVKGEPEDAIKALKEKDYQLAFFLNPTKINEVLEVADAGATMPQKSTFFYPKLVSGLVMYKF